MMTAKEMNDAELAKRFVLIDRRTGIVWADSADPDWKGQIFATWEEFAQAVDGSNKEEPRDYIMLSPGESRGRSDGMELHEVSLADVPAIVDGTDHDARRAVQEKGSYLGLLVW